MMNGWPAGYDGWMATIHDGSPYADGLQSVAADRFADNSLSKFPYERQHAMSMCVVVVVVALGRGALWVMLLIPAS